MQIGDLKNANAALEGSLPEKYMAKILKSFRIHLRIPIRHVVEMFIRSRLVCLPLVMAVIL